MLLLAYLTPLPKKRKGPWKGDSPRFPGPLFKTSRYALSIGLRQSRDQAELASLRPYCPGTG